MSTRPYRDVETLLEALPYIREFHGKTVVIKYGGAAMVDPSLKAEFARDVVLLKYVGMNPVIVHGGGPEITAMSERLDLPVRFVDGLRVSDAETVQIARMVLGGKVNSDIVLLINGHGQPAVGINGEDARLFQCTKKHSSTGADLGFVGDIKHVNTGLLNHLTDDYVPVIASVGADSEGNSYNINADDAASAVAAALGAYKIMFMTDVAGWLLDAADPESLISEASVSELEEAIPSISGGMRPKLQACVDAVRSGVGTASIIDGRVPHTLLTELFTDAGSGTIIRPDGSCQ
jgi:acetylglutamate kinase